MYRSHRHRVGFLKHVVVMSVAVCFLVSIPEQAAGYNLIGHKWAKPDDYKFHVNLDNFESSLSARGLTLTQTQHLSWILYSFSQWRILSGADWETEYMGTTKASGCYQTENPKRDGINTVDADNSCFMGNCKYVGMTYIWVGTSTSEIVEADICIFAEAHSEWVAQGAAMTSTSMDLVSVLVHEVGHALGLDHTDDTAMDPVIYEGTMEGRYLSGDNIQGVRAAFPGTNDPVSRTRYWQSKKVGANSWSTPYSFPGSNHWLEPAASIGWTAGGADIVVAGSTGRFGDRIHLSRSNYPLTSSSSWSNVVRSYDSWHRPAVSSAGYNYYDWVAAWTNAGVSVQRGHGGMRFS